MFIRTGAAAARPRSFVTFAGASLAGIVALLVCQSALAAYEVVAVTNGGTIDGVVTLSGTPPSGAPIKHQESGLLRANNS